MPENVYREVSGNPRSIIVLAVLLWMLAFLSFLGHVSGLVLEDERAFTLVIVWLIGLGCCGCPFFGVRILGRHLSAYACKNIAAALGSISLLLTVLFAIGQETPTVDDMAFALILPLAAAIQAFNAAEAIERVARVRTVFDAQVKTLNDQWHIAVRRAQMQHLETCIIAEKAHERHLAELVTEAECLNREDMRALLALLQQRAALEDRVNKSSRVVPFPRVNGNGRM